MSPSERQRNGGHPVNKATGRPAAGVDPRVAPDPAPSFARKAAWFLRHGTSRVGAALLSALLGSCLTGCGYSTQRPFRSDIQTIHVEMFQNKDFRRELEFRLTESICKRIEMDTPYRLAPARSADALLTGEILRVDNRTFGDDLRTDRPREIGTNVVTRFRLKDMRTGEILLDRPRFVYQATYIPPAGETFADGMTRAMDGLAEQIVEAMETGW